MFHQLSLAWERFSKRLTSIKTKYCDADATNVVITATAALAVATDVLNHQQKMDSVTEKETNVKLYWRQNNIWWCFHILFCVSVDCDWQKWRFADGRGIYPSTATPATPLLPLNVRKFIAHKSKLWDYVEHQVSKIKCKIVD